MAVSPDTLAAQLAEAGLVPQAELAALREQHQPADAEALARLLVKQKVLTAYQAQQAYAGKSKALVLGNYVILDKLGQGGMGMVLKARHRRMNRIVALKVLSPAVTKTPDAMKRFQREVEAAAKLHHPNIVAAYDADEVNGTHFLVMEYVEGTDLSVLVKKKGPLPVDQGIKCLFQAAKGLEFAHQHGVIHRDIKPANLLLDNHGTVKVLDMGLARIEGETGSQAELTSTGAVMGTVDYMAPEQALSTKTADARSDIYSLGISLWYLLTARPAYEGDSLMARLLAHRETPPPSLKGARGEVPVALDALFQKMVAKQPKDRCQSMAEVIALLETIHLPRAASAKSAPSFTTGPSEESKLGEFMGVFGGGTDPNAATRSTPKQIRSATLATPGAGSEYEATVTSAQSSEGTDPHTLTRLSRRTPPTAGARPAWWKRRTIQAAAGTAAVLLAVAIFRPRQEKVPAAVMNPSAPSNPGSVSPSSPSTVPAVSKAAWHGWPAGAPMPAIAPFDAAQAKQFQETWADYLKVPVEYKNSLGMTFRLIPPGEYMRGSTPEEIEEALSGRPDLATWPLAVRSEGPRHRVILTNAIFPCVHETRQQDYQKVIGTNPSTYSAGGKQKAAVAGLDTSPHPVDSVSWFDAVDFCTELSKQENLSSRYGREAEEVQILAGDGYFLLTEAEWEYAARAGTTTRFAGGNDVSTLLTDTWYQANADHRTHSVGELASNAFGLFDMQGNVAEWLQDGYEKTSYSRFAVQPAINPAMPLKDDRKVRGGNVFTIMEWCRCAMRNHLPPATKVGGNGFRIALSVDGVRQSLSQSSPPDPATIAGVNHVLQFDGIDDYVDVTSDWTWDGSELTVEAWLVPPSNKSTVPGLGRTIFACDHGDGALRHAARLFNYMYQPRSGNAVAQLVLNNLSTNSGSVSPSPFILGELTHVAGVWRGEMRSLFVNGHLQRAIDLPVTFTDRKRAGYTWIGAVEEPREGAPPIWYFKGQMHAVRILSKAIYDAEFKPAPDLTSLPGTVALYRFEEAAGDVLKDHSGHGRHGKIHGATWSFLKGERGSSGKPLVNSDADVDQEIDLLKDVKASGEPSGNLKWTREGETLVGQGIAPKSGSEWFGMMFPREITGDYDLEIDFDQRSCYPLHIDIPVGDTFASFDMSPASCGMLEIDDKHGQEFGPPYHHTNVKLKANVVQKFAVSVRHAGDNVFVRGMLDGELVGEFSGRRKRLSLPHWVNRTKPQVFIGALADMSNMRLAMPRAIVRLRSGGAP